MSKAFSATGTELDRFAALFDLYRNVESDADFRARVLRTVAHMLVDYRKGDAATTWDGRPADVTSPV